MHIPLIDLETHFARVSEQVREAVERVWSHRLFLMGPEVGELEQKLAAYTGMRHCVACSSGTDALQMALMAHEVGPGDAVFTSAFTFFASAETIALRGATPVFVDVDPRTFNIDPQRLEDAILRTNKQGALRARAIMPVDLFGLPAEYDAINALGERHGLLVIGDAAQSFGARYHGRASGGLATVSTTSFYPTKPLAACGDGGAVFTDDDALADKLRSIRMHGQGRDKYDNVRLGLTARLDTLQAAVLLCKLAVFDDELSSRREAARHYAAVLDGVVQIPHVPAHCESAWAHYSILSDERERLIGALHAAGIGSAVYYRKCMHQMQPFAHLDSGPLPHAEDCARRILSLPMHPYMTPQMVARVGEVVRTTLGGGKP